MAPAAEQVKEAMTEHEAILEVNAVNGYLNIRANPVWLAGRLLGGDVRHMANGSRREVLIEHCQPQRPVPCGAEPETPSLATPSSVCTDCGGTASRRSITSMTWANKWPCSHGRLRTCPRRMWKTCSLSENLRTPNGWTKPTINGSVGTKPLN